MQLLPNAKINIGLNVGNTRPDGYHNIETVFYPIGLHDVLDIRPTDEPTTFTTNGINIDCDTEQNLIIRTLRIFQQQFHIGNVTIQLTKNIPFGAGLGGGSSDAAFTAYGLNLLFGLNLKPQQLADIIAPIGADCPFFIYNQPMFAQGIGEQLTPLTLNLTGLWLALVKPDIKISTATAYKQIIPQPLNQQLKLHICQPVQTWTQNIHNRFEQSVFPHYPLLAKIKNLFYQSGALYASMTGTGAAVYALFNHKPALNENLSQHFTFIQQL